MVRVRLILAVAFLLAFVGVAQADNAYMPVAREPGSTWLHVHVIACPAWPGQGEHVAGRRVEVRDNGGRVLVWAETTETGDAVMQANWPATVLVALDSGQAVTVRRGAVVYVAFWVGQCGDRDRGGAIGIDIRSGGEGHGGFVTDTAEASSQRGVDQGGAAV